MPLRTYLGPRVCCLAKAPPRSPIWFTYSFDSWRSYMVHLGSRNFHQLIDDLWRIWCMVYLGPKSFVNHRVHMPVLLVTCFQHFNNTLWNQTLKPNVLTLLVLKLPKYLIPPGHRLHFQKFVSPSRKKSKVSPLSHFSQISLYWQLSNEKDNSESHSCLPVD